MGADLQRFFYNSAIVVELHRVTRSLSGASMTGLRSTGIYRLFIHRSSIRETGNLQTCLDQRERRSYQK